MSQIQSPGRHPLELLLELPSHPLELPRLIQGFIDLPGPFIQGAISLPFETAGTAGTFLELSSADSEDKAARTAVLFLGLFFSQGATVMRDCTDGTDDL